MRYRPHRGGLAESLELTVELDGTKAALVAHLRQSLGPYVEVDRMTEATVTVEPYGFDARCGWDTHTVMFDGWVLGMTDGPVIEEAS